MKIPYEPELSRETQSCFSPGNIGRMEAGLRCHLLGQLLSPLLRSGPKVPKFVPVDVQAEQKKAIEGNISSLPALKGLGADINAFNTEQLQAMLRKFIPQYDEITGRISGNIASQLRGELPGDVAGQVQRNAAVRSLYGGYGGSGMARNLVARDLGLTRLDLTQRGLDSATRWTMASANALQPGMFNVQSMFVRPEFQAEFAARERNAQFQRNWVKNQIDSQYDLGNQYADALITIDAQFSQMASSIAGSAAGAAMTCWVAREVFGKDSPKWVLFREWLLADAPKWLVRLYLRYGERIAEWIKNKPPMKAAIRSWMESRIEAKFGKEIYV